MHSRGTVLPRFQVTVTLTFDLDICAKFGENLLKRCGNVVTYKNVAMYVQPPLLVQCQSRFNNISSLLLLLLLLLFVLLLYYSISISIVNISLYFAFKVLHYHTVC